MELIACEMTEPLPVRQIGPYRLGRLYVFRERFKKTGEILLPPLFRTNENQSMRIEYERFLRLSDSELETYIPFTH
jgi:hypothetical protein